MSKIHILDKDSPNSKAEPRWVPHTRTLCGKEFHLGSGFLVVKEPKPELNSVICKTCAKKSTKGRESWNTST